MPPLPPLPGMEAPPEETPAQEETATPPEALESSEDIAEVPPELPEMEMPSTPPPAQADASDEVPEFGLFDPSSLPAPEMAEGEDAMPPLPATDESDMAGGADVAPDIEMDLPDFGAPMLPEGGADETQAAKADEEEGLPPMPDFSAMTGGGSSDGDIPPIELPDIPDLAAQQNAAEEEDSVADLAPPELPDEPPMNEALADALPSWATDEALPSLKPMPLERQQAREAKAKQESEADYAQEAPPELPDNNAAEQSIANFIDEQIRSGGNYEEDGDFMSDAMPDGAGEKRVVWPENFKTQTLPPEIYRKKYSNANRHLPHAVYQQEIQAHLFGAVGANDPDAVRALLRTGVPLDVKNSMGEDLVMHAVKSGATGTLQLLLALGAEPSAQDRYGATPLHRAVFMGRQDMSIILLRAGANAYVNDMSGVTPMAIAVARRDQPMMQTLGYYQSSQFSQNQHNAARYQPY